MFLLSKNAYYIINAKRISATWFAMNVNKKYNKLKENIWMSDWEVIWDKLVLIK